MAECAIEESIINQKLGISIAELKEIKQEFDEGGITRLETFVKGKVEEWNQAKVSVAVIGRTGAGKSTFINAFLDLDDDEEAAETGVTETTLDIQSYQNPKHPNITLWDLPGVGTKNFPKKTYLQDMKVENYDIFILMTSNRFTEDDECKWLASELNKIGRVIFFVRTKVWYDVKNDMKKKKKNSKTEEGLIFKIREECCKNLAEFIGGRSKLFLIDSHEPKLLDFDQLRHDVVTSLTVDKKEALLQIFRSVPANMIKMKAEVMKKRILYKSFLSGDFGLMYVPGTSLAIDTMLLTQLRDEFAEYLGLTEDLLSNLNTVTNSSEVYEFVKAIIFTCREECLEESLNYALVTISETTEHFYLYHYPFIGPVISACVSFAGMYLAASRMLERMVADALKINDKIADEVAKTMSTA